ncbi:MAG: cobyric acid synthase [Streptosporangiaceae bacterium]
MGTVLVAGTGSDVGKSVIVAGLCRMLARQGVSVAPFKAQNMSLNSYVTRRHEEISRAQAVQAWAARVEPEAAMNPILLKPGSDTRSQLIVMGHSVGERRADEYWGGEWLLDTVVESHRGLRRRFDVVVCEGAGSPAEINLRADDIVNMGFARAVHAPTILVGDIDRGGVFASLVGTLALLSPDDQALVAGFIVNKFRGDRRLLEPGLDVFRELTGRPTYGVLPYVHGVALDAEDAIEPATYLDSVEPRGPDVLRVHVVAFPRMSNHTDLDALAAEPGVVVRFVWTARELADADLVVLPGTRATVDDLAWLRDRGFDDALRRRAAAGLPVLGVCGGYQMLGTLIEDGVESGAGGVAGLGVLPVRTLFRAEKTLGRPRHRLADGTVVEGYEIHHGVVTRDGGAPFVAGEGCRVGAVAGTVCHGLFENDRFRRAYLSEVAHAAGRQFTVASDTAFAAIREARIDRLADLVAEHLDTVAVRRLLDGGSGRERPVLSLIKSNGGGSHSPGAGRASRRSTLLG